MSSELEVCDGCWLYGICWLPGGMCRCPCTRDGWRHTDDRRKSVSPDDVNTDEHVRWI